MTESVLLWQPDQSQIDAAHVTRFARWLDKRGIASCADYAALLDWSIAAPEAFWDALRRFESLPIHAAGAVTDGQPMPATRWYPGATVNYVEQVYRHAGVEHPAVVLADESGERRELSWADMQRQVASLAALLREQGVAPGDRVAAYLPNVPEAIIAFHAVASIGAVWSVCAPDLGVQGVLDRFAQIEPVALIVCDGYRYGGRAFERDGAVRSLLDGLPSVRCCLRVSLIDAPPPEDLPVTLIDWSDATSATCDWQVTPVDFSHPLWIVYSSGTTGKPKAIVHGHGGIVLEHVKQMRLQLNLNRGDRFMWFSSTAWMMWNYNIAGLLVGATVCLYDGNPGKPDLSRLWQVVDQLDVQFFGAGAAYFDACRQAGLRPGEQFALGELRAMGSTGSPLSPDGFDWVYAAVKADLYLSSISGGTDFASACVGGAPTVPVWRGEISCRSLGCAVASFDPAGEPVIDEVGELVITAPMPSMPVMFWNDPDGQRYRDSYFSMYPEVWQHGDWIRITDRGSAVIYGRSDATINRQGIRMGTADIYQVVEAEPEVADSLIVDLEFLGRDSYLPLFIVLADGAKASDDLRARIRSAIREQLSPRHVPDDIFVIDAVPRTFSGKKMEIPVRRLLLGQSGSEAINRDTMSNPDSIDWFVDFAARLQNRQPA